MTRRRFTGFLAAAAVGSILAMGPAAPAALAHVDVVATSPRKGAKLAKMPRAVTVTFSAQILGGSIVVKNGAGRVVSKRGGRDPSDVRRLRATTKSGLGKGRYVVRWKAKSPDGHVQSGSFRFSVR
jgi:methionine-rich copper-binding protein CopC